MLPATSDRDTDPLRIANSSDVAPGAKTMLRFGRFELDPLRRTLSQDGAPIQLRPMAISLLCHLVQERDLVVPKQELLEIFFLY